MIIRSIVSKSAHSAPLTRFRTLRRHLFSVLVHGSRAGAEALAALLLIASMFARSSAATPQLNQSGGQTGGTTGSLAQLDLSQLGNIEVTTASKEPEQVWQTPAAIFVLTQEDIRRSGATSIPEALRLVPGVEVARIDSDHWAIGVRGFGSQFSRSLLVLIDGRSVYTTLFAGVFWDVQDTLLEDIDRIEVIRGPGGTIWGANAVNGVINIITKDSKNTHGLLVSAGGGNVDQGTGSIRYGGGNGKTFNYRLFGKASSTGNEFHSDGQQFDDWRMQRGGFRMDWNSSQRDTVTLQGDIYHGDNGERTFLGSFSPPAQIILAGNDEVSGGNILGRWRHEFLGGSDIQIQAYYDRTNRQAPQFGETRDTFDFDFLHHIELHRQDLLWGFGARESPSDFIQTFATLNMVPNRQTDSIYSAFVQDEIHIVPDKVSFTVGTKIERNNYSGFEVEPSARILWTPSPHQTFWGAITRSVRTPSRLDTDIALTDFLGFSPALVPVYLKVAGDPTFAPESLLGYEAGYRSLIASTFYVDVSTFYNNYDNLSSFGPPSASLELSPLLPPPQIYLLFTEPYANGIKGSTAGFEIAPDWKPTNWLHLKGSYSYLHLSLKDKPGFTDTATVASDEGSSPHHMVTVQSLFSLPKRLELDLTYRYVSALPAQTVAAYSTGDVRFGWQATKNLELSLVGQNLFQPDHTEFGSTPGPNVGIWRAIYTKLTWRYGQR